MLVFLFIIASASMALPISNAASNCSVCDLQGSFTESNGYGCFQFDNGNVACTCPDRRYTMNEPCRICKRENICGDDPKSMCAETSSTSLGAQSNGTHYFACFCSGFLNYVVGQACPPTLTTTTAIPVGQNETNSFA